MINCSIPIFTSKYLCGTGLECETPLLRSRPSCYNCAPILFYQGFQFGDRVSQTSASSHCFLSKPEHKLHGQKVRKAVKENLTSFATLELTNTFFHLFDGGWPPLHVCLKLDIWKAGNEIWKTERGGELLRRGSRSSLDLLKISRHVSICASAGVKTFKHGYLMEFLKSSTSFCTTS